MPIGCRINNESEIKIIKNTHILSVQNDVKVLWISILKCRAPVEEIIKFTYCKFTGYTTMR